MTLFRTLLLQFTNLCLYLLDFILIFRYAQLPLLHPKTELLSDTRFLLPLKAPILPLLCEKGRVLGVSEQVDDLFGALLRRSYRALINLLAFYRGISLQSHWNRLLLVTESVTLISHFQIH